MLRILNGYIGFIGSEIQISLLKIHKVERHSSVVISNFRNVFPIWSRPLCHFKVMINHVLKPFSRTEFACSHNADNLQKKISSHVTFSDVGIVITACLIPPAKSPLHAT